MIASYILCSLCFIISFFLREIYVLVSRFFIGYITENSGRSSHLTFEKLEAGQTLKIASAGLIGAHLILLNGICSRDSFIIVVLFIRQKCF